MNKIKLLTAISELSLFIGCTVKSDVDEEIPIVLVNLSVDEIIAHKSCEGDGEDGEADIYTYIIIKANDSIGAPPNTVIETSEIEYELAKGESVVPEIKASAVIVPFHGMQIQLIVKSKEVDPQNTHINETFYEVLVYDEDLRCWIDWNGTECKSGSNSGTSEMTKSLQSRMTTNNQVCDVSFKWSFDIQAQ